MAPEAAAAASGSGGLKLRAEDADDLAVLSATLQDAVVAVRDLAYLTEDGAFILVASRFRWEHRGRRAPGGPGFERILCALTFETVDAVSYRGFRRSEDGRILSLLSIRFEPGRLDPGSPRGTIHLDFSGGAGIRLEVAQIACRSRDLGDPWPTPFRPRHEEEP